MDLWHYVINPTARWINLAFFEIKKSARLKQNIILNFSFLNFFDQKNENLIGFLIFLIILGTYFRVLSVFWSFKWILDQFWGIFDEKTEIFDQFLEFFEDFFDSTQDAVKILSFLLVTGLVKGGTTKRKGKGNKK